MDIKKELIELIEKYFGGSSKQSLPIIKQHDEELMQAVEVIYEPDKLDAHEEWMNRDDVREMVGNINKCLSKGGLPVNLFHEMNTDLITLEKAWVNEIDCVIGDTFIPEGVGLGVFQYHDSYLWGLKKTNVLQGMSIGAQGYKIKPEGGEQ